MTTEQNPDLTKIQNIMIPAKMIPGFRSTLAIQTGVERNLLFKTWGGLGDQICAEPTLRYALKSFKDCKISLASERPELFRHLDFHKTFNLNQEQPIWDKYFIFDTITPPNDTNLVWQFFSHLLTNCVDFPSLCALRSQLPIADREIMLKPDAPDEESLTNLVKNQSVFVHAGRHWPSKTFPKEWWNDVLFSLQTLGIQPILIGAITDDNRGTVDVDPHGCIDLRNSISVMDSIWLLQRASVLITNDSAPLHMAASGDAHIGFIATCKHPDYITHWRKGQWSWRMQNLGLGGMWDIIDHCPNKENQITVDQVDENVLKSWLPEPKKVAEWTKERLGNA